MNCLGPPQVLRHSLIGHCCVCTRSPGQNHLPALSGEFCVYICLKFCEYLSAFAQHSAMCLLHWDKEYVFLYEYLILRIYILVHICTFILACILLTSEARRGLQWANGKWRKVEGASVGGEGPVSFISSATVHEPCWLRCYFNSPSHLPFYLLIYTHHYRGCSLCDE